MTETKTKATKTVWLHTILLTLGFYSVSTQIIVWLNPDCGALNYITNPILLFALILLPIVAITILAIVNKKVTNEYDLHLHKKCLNLTLILNISALCIFCLLSFTAHTSKAMTLEYWQHHTFMEMAKTNQTTPHNDYSTPKAGDIVVLYKFGCPDCEAIYTSANQAFTDENIHIKWVSAETSVGRQLCDKYNITWVPTGVYFRHTPLGNGADIVQEQIDTVQNKQTILNQKNVETLINAYKSQE